MPRNRFRLAAIALLAALNLPILGFLGFVWMPDLHQKTVARALKASQPPAFWWPPSWRRELRTSFLLGGSGMVKDPTPGFANGVVELEAGDRVFRATTSIPNIKGGFSFGDQLLPVGPFRVRLVTPDGRRSTWIRIPEIDPGSHNMNWSFRFDEPPAGGSLREPPP
jgi:hypothetical protein